MAPVWPIQGHALHPYIMVDVNLPRFNKFLQLVTKEHKNGFQNKVDDD